MVGNVEARRTDALYIAFDDAVALFARVKDTGAKIEMALRDAGYGDCKFVCRDPESSLWSVGTYWPKAGEKLVSG